MNQNIIETLILKKTSLLKNTINEMNLALSSIEKTVGSTSRKREKVECKSGLASFQKGSKTCRNNEKSGKKKNAKQSNVGTS